jgi:acetyltransferase-like isoleucine patch superfamily enzyme
LRRPTAPKIKLGNSIFIGKDTWLNVTGMEEGKVEPAIVIDDKALIGPRVQISAKNCIHIERDATISTSVLIMDHSHGYEDTRLPISEQSITEGGRIRIGQGCWIGHGAAIVCTKGELVLGRNCVVGANAVVRRSFPPYSVIFGNPAIVIRQYDEAKKMWVPGSGRFADPEPV